jgi:hypothetical protein
MSFGTFTNMAGSAGFPAFTLTFTDRLAEEQNHNTYPRPMHCTRGALWIIESRPQKRRCSCRRRAASRRNFLRDAQSEIRKPLALAEATIRSRCLAPAATRFDNVRRTVMPNERQPGPANFRCSTGVNGRIQV